MSAKSTDPEAMRIGRYTLLEKLGEGGMGTVWKARQTESIERDVAVKLIKPGLDTAAVLDRFDTERRLLARLDHPDIASIFEAGSTDEGLPYYVMELVEGQAITDYCETHDLPIEQRLSLFQKVCRAVEHAHQSGVVHRDLKPSNILVADGDGTPKLKIIDFGIARSVGSDFTQHSLSGEDGLLGTPGYMSPEQVEGRRDIDGRSDVYSLGALLYELVSGSPPFSAETLHNAGLLEIMRIIREEEPPRPSVQANPDLRSPNSDLRELDWIALKALSKDPTQRYESPTALAEDIERHQTDRPIIARAPGLVSRAVKTYRRRRGACLVGLGIVSAIVAAFVLAKQNPQPAEELQRNWTVTAAAADGPGSLRAAIAAAPSGATIRFAPDLSGGTIALGGRPLEIDRSLLITAPEPGVTLDAGGESQGMLITEPSAEVILEGLTFTAAEGGALVNQGAVVRVVRCDFVRNVGGEFTVMNGEGGRLVMEACEISDNDGTGLTSWVGTELELRGCTIAGNRSERAAALRLRDDAKMINCTVTGNVSTPPDYVPAKEGDYPFPYGGAVKVEAYAELELEHCTVAGNSAPVGGGIKLWLGAKLRLRGSVVAGNLSTEAGPPDICFVQGGCDIQSGGGNFIGSNDGIADDGAVSSKRRAALWQDQIGTEEAPIAPMLAPLGDYGGPVPTMPPLPGSPLIDTYDPKRAPLAADARGLGRPIGRRHDTGAVEFDPEK